VKDIVSVAFSVDEVELSRLVALGGPESRVELEELLAKARDVIEKATRDLSLLFAEYEDRFRARVGRNVVPFRGAKES
jgi:hypothetical protein